MNAALRKVAFLKPSRLFKGYNNLLKDHPTKTMATTSGVSMGLGNFLCQIIAEEKSLDKIDYKRIFYYSIYAFLVSGPICRYWVYALDLHIFKNSNKNTKPLKMMLLDQTIMSVTLNGLFLTYIGYIDSGSMDKAIYKVKKTLGPILLESYKVWPLVCLINFYIIPLQHRILFGNIVGLLWNIYFSYIVRNKHHGAHHG